MFKNQLQELAQRSCFNFPSYSCIREGPDHAPRFKATVTFNGEVFESPTFCSTLRQAEHAAAEVALDLLSKKGPSKALAARILDETGVYKTLLQETTVKAGLKLPVYTTVLSGPGHGPVFSCTVELAGMSFTGAAAKSKRQAQKNAAIAAWTALKQMARSRSSTKSASSSYSSESGGNDEREQTIVTRFLATLRPKIAQKDGQRRSSLARRDLVPFDNGNIQCPGWTYPNLTAPPMAVLPATPQIFPFVGSIFQQNYGQYSTTIDQAHAPFIPGVGPFLYFLNNSIPVTNISQVTIQEIEENPQTANSHYQNTNFPSNPCRFSPIEVSFPRIPNTQLQKPDEKLQNPQILENSHYNKKPVMINSTNSAVNYRPSSSASPVTVRTINAALSRSLRPENTRTFARGTSSYSTRPCLRGNRNVQCGQNGNLMAPAVHMRSIVPVCSAPPATKMPSSSRQENFDGVEIEDCKKREFDLSASCSELNQLKL